MDKFYDMPPKQQLVWLLENENNLTPEIYAEILHNTRTDGQIKLYIDDIISQYRILCDTEYRKEYKYLLDRFNKAYNKLESDTTDEFG